MRFTNLGVRRRKEEILLVPIVFLLSSRETTNKEKKPNTLTHRNFIFYKKTKRKTNVRNTPKCILSKHKHSLTEEERKFKR